MNIISKTPSTQTVITGRMSDGSDRQETQVTTYQVTVNDNGKTLQMAFDHDPTDAEVTAKYVAKDFIDVTSTGEMNKAAIAANKANLESMSADLMSFMDLFFSVNPTL
jgi:hypothetical protein